MTKNRRNIPGESYTFAKSTTNYSTLYWFNPSRTYRWCDFEQV